MSSGLYPDNVKLDSNSALVSCEWLQQNLYSPHQVILDATFFLPRQQRNAQKEFKSQHIPGAQFFDIDEIADLNSPLPHTLPSADQFARQVGQLGIDNDTWVIIYDNNHFFCCRPNLVDVSRIRARQSQGLGWGPKAVDASFVSVSF